MKVQTRGRKKKSFRVPSKPPHPCVKKKSHHIPYHHYQRRAGTAPHGTEQFSLITTDRAGRPDPAPGPHHSVPKERQDENETAIGRSKSSLAERTLLACRDGKKKKTCAGEGSLSRGVKRCIRATPRFISFRLIQSARAAARRRSARAVRQRHSLDATARSLRRQRCIYHASVTVSVSSTGHRDSRRTERERATLVQGGPVVCAVAVTTHVCQGNARALVLGLAVFLMTQLR
jgi:hypothetical protein